MKWTHWRPIEEKCSHRNAAVYKIALLKSLESFEPIVIPRFLGEDKEGILTIGETTQMEKRRSQFKNATGHSAGILWFRLMQYTRLRQRFPDPVLAYCYSVVEDKGQAELLENRLIKEYVTNYGEAPPLNSSIPGRDNHEEWARLKG
jgi:hypothetical protein